MTTRTTDVLVIGAGPAGLLAAQRLAEQDVSVLLVDAGREHARRVCPVDRLKSCHGCRGVCNVISGFGGSIHYGDGVKLSKFPSGRRLAEVLGPERARALTADALERFCADDRPVFRGATGNTTGLEIKDYPVASLSSRQVRAVIDRLHAHVMSNPHLSLELNTQIFELVPDEHQGFTATLRSGGVEQRIRAERVVVATGRRGQRWWARQVRRLGLDFTAPTPSVGVRFEAPAALLHPGAAIHDDFKTTLVRHGVKVKTFCFCAGPGGGRLKFTDYGDHTLLDGHVIPEAGPSPTANFALLAQLRDAAGNPHNADWVERNLLTPYRALRTDRPGKPVLQWYPDFRHQQITSPSLEDFTRRAGYSPSLTDYQVANLARILPSPVHAALTSVFEELMAAFGGHPFDESQARQVAVIGLELESLWDELTLSSALETSLPGLYAAGDCSGLAQGILQAGVAGLAVAEDILTTTPTIAAGIS